MRNSVIARSRTANAERLMPRMLHRLLTDWVHSLALVQKVRAERHHLLPGLDPAGDDDFLLADRNNLHGAEGHLRPVVHDPDARPVPGIVDGPDGHDDKPVTGALYGEYCDGDRRT